MPGSAVRCVQRTKAGTLAQPCPRAQPGSWPLLQEQWEAGAERGGLLPMAVSAFRGERSAPSPNAPDHRSDSTDPGSRGPAQRGPQAASHWLPPARRVFAHGPPASLTAAPTRFGTTGNYRFQRALGPRTVAGGKRRVLVGGGRREAANGRGQRSGGARLGGRAAQGARSAGISDDAGGVAGRYRGAHGPGCPWCD